jgi:hypothetical protein
MKIRTLLQWLAPMELLRCSFIKNDAPDTSGMQEAAVKTAATADKALDWFIADNEKQAPARAAAAAKANEVSDASLEAMKTQTRIAGEADQYRKTVFEPLEREIVTDAQNFDTEQERERLAGLAQGDVAQAAGNARQQTGRAMTRMGVNPNDGKWAAQYGALDNAQVLASADAANKSRMNALTMGVARKMDAASLGRGLPGNQATAAGLALNAGSTSATTAGLPLSQGAQAAGTMGAGFNTNIHGNQASGNLYGQIAQIQNQANQADDAIFGAMGSAAGGYMARSDVNVKKDIEPVSDEEALEAVAATPVSKWSYKEGEGDGGKHVGPMAQDVKKHMGGKAAPGGKAIDLITMNGITMKAVQAVNSKVDKLVAALGVPA